MYGWCNDVTIFSQPLLKKSDSTEAEYFSTMGDLDGKG